MKPEVSIPVALATGAVVVGVYSAFTPTDADVRTVAPGTMGADFLNGSEKNAFFIAVGVCGGISLIAGDPVPFVVGGLIAVALSWTHRYSTQIDPGTGRLAGLSGGTATRQAQRTTVQVAG